MTSQIAHLIHTRPGHGNRRIFPAMMLTTATIVAVGLFLATISTIDAHDPSKEVNPASLCDGVGSGTLPVGPDMPISQTIGSPSTYCQFGITARPPHSNVSETDCQVTYTTVTSRSNYVDVAVFTRGKCDGVRVVSSIAVPGSADAAQVTSAQSSSRQALAKIVGQDVLHLPMFWHYSKAYWTYDSDLILSARQEVNRFADEYWHTHSKSSGSQMSTGNTRFQAWDSVSWHSDGFPTDEFGDVYAESEAQITAEVGGGYACDFEHEWTSGAGEYPNLHIHEQCWAE